MPKGITLGKFPLKSAAQLLNVDVLRFADANSSKNGQTPVQKVRLTVSFPSPSMPKATTLGTTMLQSKEIVPIPDKSGIQNLFHAPQAEFSFTMRYPDPQTLNGMEFGGKNGTRFISNYESATTTFTNADSDTVGLGLQNPASCLRGILTVILHYSASKKTHKQGNDEKFGSKCIRLPKEDCRFNGLLLRFVTKHLKMASQTPAYFRVGIMPPWQPTMYTFQQTILQVISVRLQNAEAARIHPVAQKIQYLPDMVHPRVSRKNLFAQEKTFFQSHSQSKLRMEAAFDKKLKFPTFVCNILEVTQYFWCSLLGESDSFSTSFFDTTKVKDISPQSISKLMAVPRPQIIFATANLREILSVNFFCFRTLSTHLHGNIFGYAELAIKLFTANVFGKSVLSLPQIFFVHGDHHTTLHSVQFKFCDFLHFAQIANSLSNFDMVFFRTFGSDYSKLLIVRLNGMARTGVTSFFWAEGGVSVTPIPARIQQFELRCKVILPTPSGFSPILQILRVRRPPAVQSNPLVTGSADLDRKIADSVDISFKFDPTLYLMLRPVLLYAFLSKNQILGTMTPPLVCWIPLIARSNVQLQIIHSSDDNGSYSASLIGSRLRITKAASVAIEEGPYLRIIKGSAIAITRLSASPHNDYDAPPRAPAQFFWMGEGMGDERHLARPEPLAGTKTQPDEGDDEAATNGSMIHDCSSLQQQPDRDGLFFFSSLFFNFLFAGETPTVLATTQTPHRTAIPPNRSLLGPTTTQPRTPSTDNLLSHLPSWTGEILTFYTGVRGTARELAWEKALQALNIPDPHHPRITTAAVAATLDGYETTIQARAGQLHRASATATDSPADTFSSAQSRSAV
jgi:hypothetical protein